MELSKITKRRIKLCLSVVNCYDQSWVVVKFTVFIHFVFPGEVVIVKVPFFDCIEGILLPIR